MSVLSYKNRESIMRKEESPAARENKRMNLLEELYREYAVRLYGYLLTLTCSRADAEDLLQELFLKLAKSGIENRKISKLSGYLFTSARNLAISYIRRHARERQRRGEWEQIVQQKPDTGITDERLAHVNRALTTLPLKQREVVVLRIYEDMSFRQIAKVIGISANTAASRYRYGLEKLKKILDEKMNQYEK